MKISKMIPLISLTLLLSSCGSDQGQELLTSTPKEGTESSNTTTEIGRTHSKLPPIVSQNLLTHTNIQGLPKAGRPFEQSDRRYQHLHVQRSKENRAHNHLNFDDGLRSITLTGIDITIEENHEDGYYELFNQARDIKRFEIHAETLTIKSPLHLPSAQLIIKAREVIFVGEGKFILTPSEFPLPAPKGMDGANGLDTPDAYIYAKNIHTFDSAGKPRVILSGGRGQQGGAGEQGRPGSHVKTLSPNNNIVFKCETSAPAHIIDGNGNIIFKSMTDKIVKNEQRCRSTEGINRVPGNGGDALPGGLPGAPGKSGNFYTNKKGQDYLADVTPGRVGLQAPTAKGGSPGQPNPAVAIIWDNLGYHSKKEIEVLSGKDAIGPELMISLEDRAGEVIIETEKVHNASVNRALKKKIKFLEDHYRTHQYALTHFYASELKARIEDITIEKRGLYGLQALTRASNILNQLEDNKNYYGEHAYAIPLLSLESIVQVFDHQIERSLNTIFFARWTRDANQSIELRQSEIKRQRNVLEAELEEDHERHRQTLEQVEDVRQMARVVERESEKYLEYLQILEKEIEQIAHHNLNQRHDEQRGSTLKRIISTAAALAKVVPVGQPTFLAATSGLQATLSLIESDSWDERYKSAQTIYQATQNIDLSQVRDDWNQQWSQFRTSQLRGLSTSEKFERLDEFKNFINPTYQEIRRQRSQWKEQRLPAHEVETEIDAIKKKHPEFNQAMTMLKELHQKKTALDQKVHNTLSLIQQQQNDILEKMTLIASLQVDAKEHSVTLSSYQSEALNTLEKRAAETLFRYYEYYKRAYYFRMLEHYPQDFDLQSLYEAIDQMIQTQDARPSARVSDNLKVLFRGEIDKILTKLLESSNGYSNEMQTSATIELTPAQLKALSQKSKSYINLKEFNALSPYQQNPRIENIEIKEVVFDAHDLRRQDYLDLIIEHSGMSTFEKGEQKFFFTHLYDNNANPFFWGKRVHLGNSNFSSELRRSRSYENLLQAILSDYSQGSYVNSAFISPSAKSDLRIKLKGGAQKPLEEVEVQKVVLEIDYTFTHQAR